MRRTTTLTAALLLGVTASAVPVTTTTAAAATCRGAVATIVGDGPDIVGTEGRDVVVTHGSQFVRTLGGDDLICVTGPDQASGTTRPVQLDAGPGDDVVDGTAAPSWPVDGQLGAGADRFEGGTGDDDIHTGVRELSTSVDTDRDIVLTGGGPDSVTSGMADRVNPDVIELGAGDDFVVWMSSEWVDGAGLDGGAGADGALLRLAPGANTLDNSLGNAAGELRQDTTVLARWNGMEVFAPTAPQTGTSSLAITGGAADERFSVGGRVPVVADLGPGNDELSVFSGLAAPAPVVADLGEGDDHLAASRALPTGSRLVAGPGRDALTMGSESHALSWDLAGKDLEVGDIWTVAADGFEDATLMAPRVTLWGSGADNDLAFVSCDGTLRGRDGNDRLSMTRDFEFETYRSCHGKSRMVGGRGRDRFVSRGHTRDRMVGGRGHDRFDARGSRDVIFGGPGRDVALAGNQDDRFLGGPGRDRVDGGAGRDTCRAEHTLRCERR